MMITIIKITIHTTNKRTLRIRTMIPIMIIKVPPLELSDDSSDESSNTSLEETFPIGFSIASK